MHSTRPFKIIDVRPPTEYGICQLPGSKSSPSSLTFLCTTRLIGNSTDIQLKDILSQPEKLISECANNEELFIVCRLGNDSQIAAQALRGVTSSKNSVVVKDVIGGLRAWSTQIDQEFPVY
jgi:adenylyltransferase/sulfurtransferase